MNQRNVEALAEALALANMGSHGVPPILPPAWLEPLARQMIERYGVLVPSSLTDDESRRVWEDSGEQLHGDPFMSFTERGPRFMRDGLARVARGETEGA